MITCTPPKLSTSMIGQGATHTHSPSSPPRPSPPHPNLASLAGDANVDILTCSPYDSFASAPLSNTGDVRRPSAKAPHPSEILKCPRCDSLDTKFCYYNNYSLTQPRYFCKNCKRYWTAGGALRNVPVGGGLRKNKRSKLKLAADAEAALVAQAMVAGGVQQQQQQAGALGVGVVGEAPQKLDNRTTVPANAAMPSHIAVGIPEMGMYPHPSRGGTATHNYGEPMVDQNSGAVVNQQEGDFYSRSIEKGTGLNYFVEPGHVPQFYSSYTASLPVQYGNPIPGGVESGFPMNYTFLPPSEKASNAHVEEAPNDRTVHKADASTNNSASRGAVKQEKDAEAAGNPYDWQLISEGLFNSGGSTADGNFFYMPSSSWPDFSQFNDAGPG